MSFLKSGPDLIQLYGSIIKESWVYKEGGGKKAKTWKKRWLVLFERSLRYYGNQNRTDEKGFIDLTTAGNVLALEDAYKGRKFCFTIETPSRMYYIQTFSDAEINQWVFYIRDMVDNAKVRKAIPSSEVTLKVHPEAAWDALPSGWKMHFNHTLSRPYFVDYNHNKKTTYQDPRPLPPGWESRRDEKGFHYFIHIGDGIATHTDPRPSLVEPTPEEVELQKKFEEQFLEKSRSSSKVNVPVPTPLNLGDSDSDENENDKTEGNNDTTTTTTS